MKANKILAILFATLILLSVFPALGFAEEATVRGKAKAEARVVTKEKVSERLEAVKEKAAEKIEAVKEKVAERKEAAKEKVLAVREKVKTLRAHVLEAREKYKNAREDLAAAKKKFKAAKGAERDKLKAELKGKSVSALQHMVDAMQKRLENLKEKGYAPANAAEIEAKLSELEAKLAGELTKEQVVEIAKELRELNKSFAQAAKDKVAEGLKNRMKVVIEKAEKAYNKMTELVSKLKEKGRDTTRLETALAKYKADIEAAKTELEAAKTAKDVRTVLKKVHAQLKKGFHLMQKIVQSIRKANAGQEVTEADVTLTAAEEAEAVAVVPASEETPTAATPAEGSTAPETVVVSEESPAEGSATTEGSASSETAASSGSEGATSTEGN